MGPDIQRTSQRAQRQDSATTLKAGEDGAEGGGAEGGGDPGCEGVGEFEEAVELGGLLVGLWRGGGHVHRPLLRRRWLGRESP